MASRSDPVVCTLSPAHAGDRLAEWSDLRHVALSIEPLVDGVRFRLDPVHAGAAADLAERETNCCTFLEIRTAPVDGEIEMTITSPNPDGVPVARLLAGLES